jgi:Ca-activated chloride channel homolog
VDLSKSILAEDISGVMSRWEATQIGLKTLLDELEERGGHRIALVVFAAKPWVICPLTSDYDHLRMKIDELTPITPPPEIYPKNEEEPFVSGTRIGEALRYAVTIHDSRFTGYQDILLLSDGDDPAPQKDFDVGITAARQTNIPVHVIGIGDKEKKTPIPIEVEEGIPETQLQEADLKKIALEAKGEYASWNGSIPLVGDFFRTKIEPKPTRELSEDALPQPKEQYLWFLVPAMILLLLSWWLEERK